MYRGLTAKVNWRGEVSSSINIIKGVHQGGILSIHFYKTFTTTSLQSLNHLRCQVNFIESIYVGFLTVTDHALLLSVDELSKEWQ